MRWQQLARLPRHLNLYFIFLGFVCSGILLTPDVYSETKAPIFNGYFTLEYEVANKNVSSRRGTFDLRHFNLISKYHVSRKSIVFGEIEWEHGPDFEDDGAVGGIKLERGWFEYAFSSKFKLRAGKFLTPFGNYNIVHDATPAYTTTILPLSLYGKHGSRGRLFSKFSLGVMINGAFSNDKWESEYSLLLTNGRGNNPYEVDDNANKGIGASFSILDVGGTVQFTATAYRDRNNENGLNTREAAYSGSLRFWFNQFKVESEGALFRLETGNNTGLYINKLGGYIQCEYTIRNKFTPVVRFDLFDPDNKSGDDLETVLTVGMNLALDQKTFLKSEIHFHEFGDNLKDDFRMFISSLAVAF